jgi:uncharacterized protein GlcG (DUF336 family)
MTRPTRGCSITSRSANVVISIVDSGGHAVMLQRLDGSHLAAIGIAEGKAAPRSSFAGRPRRPARAQSVRARAQEVHRSSCGEKFIRR